MSDNPKNDPNATGSAVEPDGDPLRLFGENVPSEAEVKAHGTHHICRACGRPVSINRHMQIGLTNEVLFDLANPDVPVSAVMTLLIPLITRRLLRVLASHGILYLTDDKE